MSVRVVLCLALLVATGCGGTSAPADEPLAAPAEVRRLVRLQSAPTPLILPPGARQLQEGYWLGAMFGPADVAALQRLGIEVVLSAVEPSDATQLALASAGIERVRVPMGASFQHADRILLALERHDAERVFIHCRHGADRTGAIAAFVLTVRHGWSLADALFSVLYASEADVDGLVATLDRYGIDDPRTVDDETVGFYSLRAAGRVGGMKARNPRYARLVETTIQAVIARREAVLPSGPRLARPTP